MAMSLSRPHPERPYEETGVKLGDEQFELTAEWEAAGRLALVGMGVEPGLADVFARYAADHLFASIDEVGIRDGADLVVDGYDFAPTFSIWTTIEECLNPRSGSATAVVHPAPFAETELFDFPGGSGRSNACTSRRGGCCSCRAGWTPGGSASSTPRRRVHRRAQAAPGRADRTEPVDVRGTRVSPRDVSPPACPTRRRWATGMRGPTPAGPRHRTGSDGAAGRCTSTR